MNLAIAGTYPDTAIDYPQVLVSKGPLPPAKNPTSVADSEGNIFFGWEDNSGNGTAKPDYKVILVAYFPADKTAIFTIGAATRKDCQAMLPIVRKQNQQAETWIGFLSDEEKDAADSVYCGKVLL